MKEKFLIIESSTIVVEGLRAVIESGIPGSQVFDITDKSCTIAEEIARTNADIVIMNPLDQMYSFCFETKKIHHDNPGIRVFAIVRQHTENSILTGYDGIIDINDSKEKIIDAFRKVKIHPSASKQSNLELSERERSVLILIAEGMMSKEIADKLNISIHTVNSHRKSICHKTGIKSVAGLTLYAMLNGLIE